MHGRDIEAGMESSVPHRGTEGEQTENRQTPEEHGDLSEHLYLTMAAINVPQNYG